MSVKMEAMGGSQGEAFDDGVFDGVRKITIGVDSECITYIKIEYQKDEIFETREHGTIKGDLKEFTLDYPDEYIKTVSGSYEYISSYDADVITTLTFKTTYATSPQLGVPSNIIDQFVHLKEFTIEAENGGKLLGFHGRAGQALYAIGPHYFAVKPPLKHFAREGGEGGGAWDDGAYDGVRKIVVGRSAKFDNSVSYVRIEYAKGERVVPHIHGTRYEIPEEFVLDYPYEHITLVEGTTKDDLVSSLKFKTSKGRASPTFGNVTGKTFSFEEEGFKLVGFCGRSGYAIDALGAHFAPFPVPMGPFGGSKGDTFDDGAFDGVKKLTVGADDFSLTYVKIEYVKDGKVETREHGTIRGDNGLKEFTVDYPDDYIIAVGGSHDHIFTYDTTLITSLYFTTFKGFNSPKFGETKGTEFKLQNEIGGKLVGLLGRAGTALDAIGGSFERP